MASRGSFRTFGHLGLRARIAATFALGAVVVSLVLITTLLVLVRRNLLNERERQLTDRAEVNVGLVADKVGREGVDAQTVFGSLATIGRPSVLIRDKGSATYVPISLDTRYGAASVPDALVEQVLEERDTALMRYRSNGETLVVVGVPLPEEDGAYFEVNQLRDIERSIDGLRIPVALAATLATVSGAVFGWTASRRVLKPLGEMANVATDISEGRFDARLPYSEWADDPDLAPLVSSFNNMVGALQDRIDRDARFASDVSHELRSPLTTFNASIEVLRNARDEMPERAQLALDLLSSDMARFTQLVEDLLEISRFDAGAVRLEIDPVPLVETIRMVVRALSATPIPVEADSTLEQAIVYCDKRRVVRIIANYVDNARKYADGATRILVERAPADPGDDDSAEPTPDSARIIVEDEGPGVPELEQDRIFDRFNRGTLGGSRGSDLGVGLGLALAAEHARLQGGRVWVEPRTDGVTGARFILELPLIDPPPGQEPDAEDHPTPLDEVVTATGQHDVIQVDRPAHEARADSSDSGDADSAGADTAEGGARAGSGGSGDRAGSP
ncbi:MAG TPA: HAMP domain-containing sensor histidine kinase [Microthrixaceae bacterium]|nr:HAMP domain-containing sensor histidine kinase [Microthrixaceae bacterium]